MSADKTTPPERLVRAAERIQHEFDRLHEACEFDERLGGLTGAVYLPEWWRAHHDPESTTRDYGEGGADLEVYVTDLYSGLENLRRLEAVVGEVRERIEAEIPHLGIRMELDPAGAAGEA